jgi:hypothetical protein
MPSTPLPAFGLAPIDPFDVYIRKASSEIPLTHVALSLYQPLPNKLIEVDTTFDSPEEVRFSRLKFAKVKDAPAYKVTLFVDEPSNFTYTVPVLSEVVAVND